MSKSLEIINEQYEEDFNDEDTLDKASSLDQDSVSEAVSPIRVHSSRAVQTMYQVSVNKGCQTVQMNGGIIGKDSEKVKQ